MMARKCPKHVERIISAKKHSVTCSWFFFCTHTQWCTNKHTSRKKHLLLQTASRLEYQDAVYNLPHSKTSRVLAFHVTPQKDLVPVFATFPWKCDQQLVYSCQTFLCQIFCMWNEGRRNHLRTQIQKTALSSGLVPDHCNLLCTSNIIYNII
jgi:hypothetical protein